MLTRKRLLNTTVYLFISLVEDSITLIEFPGRITKVLINFLNPKYGPDKVPEKGWIVIT